MTSNGNHSQPSSQRCAVWQLRTRRLEFTASSAIMGIVNCTPDSFSDGGQLASVQDAVDYALRLEDDGADILDIGGESTRPYSQPVLTEIELRRVVPVVEALSSRVSCPISIDTSKASVAQAAIELGAEVINDVTGLEGDQQMISVATKFQVGVCAMHMQGTPQTMQDAPRYNNVVSEVREYLCSRRQMLIDSGVEFSRICLDPGIGFGKSHAHNVELIGACGQFVNLGSPILVGHSRKGFIAKLIGCKERDRDAGTVGISLALAQQGVQILRVHNVALTRDALRCFAATGFLPTPLKRTMVP